VPLARREKTSRRSSQALLAGQKDASHQRPTGPASPRERAVSTAAGRSVRPPNARPPPAQPSPARGGRIFTRLPKGHRLPADVRGVPEPDRAAVEGAQVAGSGRPAVRDVGGGVRGGRVGHGLLERPPPPIRLGPASAPPARATAGSRPRAVRHVTCRMHQPPTHLRRTLPAKIVRVPRPSQSATNKAPSGLIPRAIPCRISPSIST
jgi:hypothetical protein